MTPGTDDIIAVLRTLSAGVPAVLRAKFEMSRQVAMTMREGGLRPDDLQSLAGIGLTTARLIENGAVADVPMETLIAALTALGHDVAIAVTSARSETGEIALHRPLARSGAPGTEIVATEGIMSGEPCFRGTRIPASTILSYARNATTAAEVFADYPSLPVDAIEALARWCAEALPATGAGP